MVSLLFPPFLRAAALVAAGFLCGVAAHAAERVEFAGAFAPAEGVVRPQESPFRSERCLNGAWQFQPVAIPGDFRRDEGNPPVLPPPRADGWEKTPVKVPSPWNVNAWGAGREVGAGTEHPYWPDSVYFPSYPAAWDSVEMGWLRRSFRVPAGWAGKRILLHFDAVAGDAQVFLNGKPVGTHFDKYLPFDFDITVGVKRDGDNELLVGVRAHALFKKQSERYAKMNSPFPTGSETNRLVGVWQDVYLLAVPEVRVDDVFVKPLVDANALELEVTLRNDAPAAQTVTLGGEVDPWVNLAGRDTLDAPVPKWRLDPAVLSFPPVTIAVLAGGTSKVALRQAVDGKLKPWAPGTPQLYAAVLSLERDGRPADRKFTRFGWRQFTIKGKDLLLNGRRIQLAGDLLHPFGAFTMSRRHIWAWYRMIQDVGGNAVRPHAQIYPHEYLDLADEMGLVVLDETALFGSSIALNFEEPEAWERFQAHLDGLVLRDRNHPSVLGWSFGNELFAIFSLNDVSPQDADRWYRQLAGLGLSVRRLDPTRPWISCDGDEDLRGTLPVWSKHFGHGLPPADRLPDIDKPLMVGESGGTYYAKPRELAEFNGTRAYESYAGRNEALAIDVYDNIVHMARPRLAYFSPSETAWFGLRHLNLGYRDFKRLPNLTDGVFFTKPYAEGQPGMQIERIPPYVTTLNPGWDPALPLYEALAMFEAEKAALAQPKPLPGPWDHRAAPVPAPPPPPAPTMASAGFVGDPAGPLGRRLSALGVPLAKSPSLGGLTIVDGDHLTDATIAAARRAMTAVQANGGDILVMAGGSKASGDGLNRLFHGGVRLTDRTVTALVPDRKHPWTRSFTLADLYFAEEGPDRTILRHGMEGPLLAKARVLLQASNTDWSLFNTAPEFAKCAAVVLYEQLEKPAGSALVKVPLGKGELALSSVDYENTTRGADKMWRILFANMGLKLSEAKEALTPAVNAGGALVAALSIGRFGAPDLAAALAKDFIGEATVRPVDGGKSGALVWTKVTSPSQDRFVAGQLSQSGPADQPFALYFSFWIRSPRALDDLLAGGPDVPKFWIRSYAAQSSSMFLNGHPLTPTSTEKADYRTLQVFENVPLKKDWNHFLVKVAGDRLAGDQPATAAIRIGSTQEEFLQQIDTAIQASP